MKKEEEEALRNIDKYGCHILYVYGDEDNPPFAYSVGIEKKTGSPEVIVTGMKRELAHFLINEYNDRVIKGENFEPNKYYEDFLEGFEIAFKIVEKKYYEEYFGWANWYYRGHSFNVLQIVYPTTSGIWPWDKEATKDFLWYNQKLYND